MDAPAPDDRSGRLPGNRSAGLEAGKNSVSEFQKVSTADFDRLVRAAEESARGKRWSEAAHRWQEVIDAAGDAAPAAFWVKLLFVLRRGSDYPQAEAVLERAQSRHGADPKIRLEAARICMAQKTWTTALLRWQRVIDCGDDRSEAWLGQITCCIRLARYEEAHRIAQAALERHGSDAEILDACAKLSLTTGRWQEAADRSLRLVDLHGAAVPGHVLARLSHAYRALGKDAQAEAALARMRQAGGLEGKHRLDCGVPALLGDSESLREGVRLILGAGVGIGTLEYYVHLSEEILSDIGSRAQRLETAAALGNILNHAARVSRAVRRLTALTGVRRVASLDAMFQRRSDTVFLLGSGNSINDLTEAQWDHIRAHDSIGFNNWFAHHHVPDLYCFEIKSQGERTEKFIRNLCQVQERYRGVPVIWRDCWSYHEKALADSAFLRGFDVHFSLNAEMEGYSADEFTRSLRGHLDVRRRARGALDGLMLQKRATISALVDLACRLGYRRIVLCGVDLNNSIYFWEDPRFRPVADLDLPRTESRLHKTNDPDFGQVTISSVLDAFGELYLGPAGCELFIAGPQSALSSSVPLYSWPEPPTPDFAAAAAHTTPMAVPARPCDAPFDAETAIKKARAATNAKRWAEAAELWAEVIDRQAEQAPVQAWVRGIDACRRSGQIARAESLADRALALHPRSVGVLAEAADVALAAGRPETAITHWRAVIAVSGGGAAVPVKAWIRLAAVYGRSGRHAEAGATVSEGLRHHPAHPDLTLEGLGAWVATGALAEAETALQAAIAQHGADAPALAESLQEVRIARKWQDMLASGGKRRDAAGKPLIPDYILVSHHPKERYQSPAGSVHRLFVNPESRIADLAGFVNVRAASQDDLDTAVQLMAQGAELLFNGMGSLSHETSVFLLTEALRLGAKVTVYWHETSWNLRLGKGLAQRGLAFGAVMQLLIDLDATHWVVSSQGTHTLVSLFGVPFERIHIVHEVVDLSRFGPPPARPKNPVPVVLGAGHLNFRKGIDTFSVIARQIRETVTPQPVFRWFSSSGIVRRLPVVPFPHDVEWMDKSDAFEKELIAGDCFVLTSRDDPAARVVLEALATGMPALVFSSTGFVEMLPRELVCNNYDQLVERLRRILNGERAEPAYYRSLAEKFGVAPWVERALGHRPAPSVPVPKLDLSMLPAGTIEGTTREG